MRSMTGMARKPCSRGLGHERLRRSVLEPAPSFGLRGAGCLADDEVEAREFGLNLAARQQVRLTSTVPSITAACARFKP